MSMNEPASVNAHVLTFISLPAHPSAEKLEQLSADIFDQFGTSIPVTDTHRPKCVTSSNHSLLADTYLRTCTYVLADMEAKRHNEVSVSMYTPGGQRVLRVLTFSAVKAEANLPPQA